MDLVEEDRMLVLWSIAVYINSIINSQFLSSLKPKIIWKC